MVLAVPVPMVKVRIVRMLVGDGLVPVPMRVRLDDRSVMVMLVMLVMDMRMLVFQRLVDVLVLVSFGEMQP